MDPKQQSAPSDAVISQSLTEHFAWLEKIIDLRLQAYFADDEGEKPPPVDLNSIPVPYPKPEGPFDQSGDEYGFTLGERIVILLALAPQLLPNLLDVFFVRNNVLDRFFTEVGGEIGKVHKGFLPTAETALFVLCGSDLEQRIAHFDLFRRDSRLFSLGLIQRPSALDEETYFSFRLELTVEFLGVLVSGHEILPDQSPDFPASRIQTALTWEDLIVPFSTMSDLDEIINWVRHGEEILRSDGLSKFIKPGYRSLFYGPPGTGKTLAAGILGHMTQREVFRIDLSLIVSKYIGETEKNLGRIFDKAQHRNWILFFDEADALFGKRTATSSSNDRYANQEVSFLLQRIEDFPGVVILATNFLRNLDDAFVRRFQSLVHFPTPEASQRAVIWQNSFSSVRNLDPAVRFDVIAQNYELTGGEIVNILRYVVTRFYSDEERLITQEDILVGIRREMQKEGRYFEEM
ncbi:MAG: ATP-binding protein [Bacteroidota bacterium]